MVDGSSRRGEAVRLYLPGLFEELLCARKEGRPEEKKYGNDGKMTLERPTTTVLRRDRLDELIFGNGSVGRGGSGVPFLTQCIDGSLVGIPGSNERDFAYECDCDERIRLVREIGSTLAWNGSAEWLATQVGNRRSV